MVVSNIVYFHPHLGKIPILTNIFSDGLKPPASIELSPFPVMVANEGLWESPTKHEIILVVTITGKGDKPAYIVSFCFIFITTCLFFKEVIIFSFVFFVLQAEFSLGQFCESHFDDFHGWHFCSSCGHQLQEIFDAEDTTDVQMEMPLPSGFPSSMGFHELAMQLEWQQNQRQFLDIPPIFKKNIFCRSLTLARLPKGIMKDSSTLKKIQIKRTCFCFAPQESTGKNKKQPTKQTNKQTNFCKPSFFCSSPRV